MFETLFEIFSAWNALLYLIGGGAVSGLGLLIITYAVYVRGAERSYRGEIVGIRSDAPGKAIYWPLVAYTDESGARHEVLANSGSSLIGGRTPGTKVTVFADTAAPKSVLLARDWWLLLCFGVVLAAFGAPFLAIGVGQLHFNAGTGLVALGLAGYLGLKLFRFLHPLLDARKAGGWQAARDAFMARSVQRTQSMAPVSGAEIAAAAATQSKNAASALPVLMLVGAGLLCGGGIWLDRQVVFLKGALAAPGVVLRNEESDSADHSPNYHAVVAFTDRSGGAVTYRDSVGSSPPMYAPGDKVRVFYAPGDASRAEIDRGFWNWLVPLLIAAAGAAMLGGAGYGFVTRGAARKTPELAGSR